MLAVVAVLAATQCQARNLAVIVGKSNSTTTISSADLLKIFKFDNHKWPDGQNVTLVLLALDKPEMRLAAQKIYKMPSEDLKNLIAEHRGAVILVDSEAALLRAVETMPGAVGLIDVYSITSKVNVMKVDGRLPLEQGYLLHGNQ